jgi:hypothetical protein
LSSSKAGSCFASAMKVEALMKGSLHTGELMGAVVAHSALRTERRMSLSWFFRNCGKGLLVSVFGAELP